MGTQPELAAAAARRAGSARGTARQQVPGKSDGVTVSNAATARAVARRTGARQMRRAALDVSAPGDAAELEAERFSLLVAHLRAPVGEAVDRPEPVGEVSRAVGPGPGMPAGGHVPVSDATRSVVAMPGAGVALAPDVRARIEPHLGVDLSPVTVHTGARAAQAATELQARAFTVGTDVFLGQGQSASDVALMAHEAVHVVQQTGGAAVSRQIDPTITSLTHEAARAMGPGERSGWIDRLGSAAGDGDIGARENLRVLMEVDADEAARSLAALPEVVTPAPELDRYRERLTALRALGQEPPEPLVTVFPGDRMAVVASDGGVALIDGGSTVGLDPEVIEWLDRLGTATETGDSALLGDEPGHVVLWDDGRALLAPGVSADLAALVTLSAPADHDGTGRILRAVEPSWRRAQEAALAGALQVGSYQLWTYPISGLNGVSLPAGSRIRFASPAFGQGTSLLADTRFLTVFVPGTNKFYAWDAHAPVGPKPHAFYHINQKGMSAQLFGQADHAPVRHLAAARSLRWIRIGGRVFLLVGVAVDAVRLTSATVESVESGSAAPVMAQAVRTIGGWGGAWLGAKALCVGGAAVTIETGPGAVVGCLVGGVVGGFVGYWAGDTIADLIHPDE